MMMKIKLSLSLLFLGCVSTIFADMQRGPDVHRVDVYKIDQYLQIIAYHETAQNAHYHYLSDVTVKYQDQVIYHETWQKQPNPYTVTIFSPNPVTVDGKTYTIEVGDHIQANITCSQGFHSTLNLVVQKAPDIMPHRTESLALE